MLIRKSLIILSAVFAIFWGINTYADEVTTVETTTTPVVETTDTTPVVQTTTTTTPSGKIVERKVITTPVPAAKEVVATPSGYASCFTVDGAWFNDTWVPKHRVCQYENSAQGVVWIEGYWGCNKATSEGVCTNWEWRSGHWEKKYAVY